MDMSRNIKVLHLEPTDVCQAACPGCDRETDKSFVKTQHHHLTVDQIHSLLSTEDIRKLDKMFMCGNYGEPAAGQHTVEIYQHFRSLNPEIILGMNTNGGIQNTSWWNTVGSILSNTRDFVVFSIDGLADTNHIYRVNVNWKKLMNNAAAFIAAGGKAHWDMLIYRHNEHQIDECEQMARDMGFRCFRAKVSKRALTSTLERPIEWAESKKYTGPIACQILKDESIFMDAQGRVSPCCWLGCRTNDLVLDFDQIQSSWSTDTPNIVCSNTCRISDGETNFTGQWKREVYI